MTAHFPSETTFIVRSVQTAKPVRLWLGFIALLIGAMVVVGGATRLTGSGLSITEWQPLLGTVPPLSEKAWRQAFENYQHIPQYELINKGMTLGAFKHIYWWEWAHRLLGRCIGLVFLLPFAVFIWQGRLAKADILKIGALFLLGAAQGALGWFMVKSGLADRVDVSQYRLAAHLSLAVAIAGYAFWLSLGLKETHYERRRSFDLAQKAAIGLGLLIYAQIAMGGFVAGLKGGLASDTWPLMNGALWPEGIFEAPHGFLNTFETPFAAQFAHRLLAYLIAILISLEAVRLWRRHDVRQQRQTRLRISITALLGAAAVQIGLGIATIIYGVPILLALMHQANAILLFMLALWHIHRALNDEQRQQIN